MAAPQANPSLLLRLVFGGAEPNDTASVQRRLQLAVFSAVALSSIATAAGVLGYQHISRAYRRHNLEGRATGRRKGRKDDGGVPLDSDAAEDPRHLLDQAKGQASGGSSSPRYLTNLPGSVPGPDAYRSSRSTQKQRERKWDESLLREQLTRNYSFLGEEGMAKLRKSFVIVVGCGGVGSWAALMLLRSGVSRLRIIDFDQVSLSSLNRHACATLADVGRPKVICCADYFAQIAPWAKVEPYVEVFKAEDAHKLLDENPDWVIDAIDNIDTKVDLLKYCYEQNIRCFSCMGAGGKADPSRVQIGDISDTYEDPLAASVRRRLRLQGIPPVPPKQQELQREERRRSKPLSVAKNGSLHPMLASAQPGLERSTSAAGEGSGTSRTVLAESSRSVSAPLQTKASEATVQRPPSLSATPERPRYSFSHSRRASSSSSLGSGVYSTPLSTPKLDPDAESPNVTVPPLDDVEEDTETSASSRMDQPDAEEGDRTFVPADASDADDIRELEPESEADKLEITIDGSADQDRSDESRSRCQTDIRNTYMIPCVFSVEKADVALLPLPEEEFEKGRVHELSPLEQFRVRILPVLGPLPAQFGLAAATYIICDLAGHPMEPLPFKGRRKLYEKILNDLDYSERRYPVAKAAGASTRFSINDIAYLFEEVFSGRSVVPPFDSLNQGFLLRWDSALPCSPSNLALFSRAQGRIHHKEVLDQGKSPYAVWGQDASLRLKQCQARDRYYRDLREM